MANPTLNEKQRKKYFDPLFRLIKKRIKNLAVHNPDVAWALQRKLWKEISYLERGKPCARKKLKWQKWKSQGRKCSFCRKGLLLPNSILDRFKATKGYTSKNARVIHSKCDRALQKKRKFK